LPGPPAQSTSSATGTHGAYDGWQEGSVVAERAGGRVGTGSVWSCGAAVVGGDEVGDGDEVDRDAGGSAGAGWTAVVGGAVVSG
jgi:hypothetical protein